ncbi:predicted protein [Mycobacterium tuberculosis T85]|nr:predicted protein [Mycobacterium tuberculosis T85]
MGDQNVRRVGDQRLGVVLQFIVVGKRDHLDRWGTTDLGALAAKQCAQLFGAASGCHRDPVAGQWRRVCLGHMTCLGL